MDRALMNQARPERRRSPRMVVNGEGKGHLKATIPVTVVNLSADGILLELKAPLRPGTTYDLSAFVPEQTLQAIVRVTRCRAGGYAADGRGGRCLLFRAGAEFASLTASQRDAIRGAVARSLGAGAPGLLETG
jgi:hypothetical protein